jgi:hypothetical protein
MSFSDGSFKWEKKKRSILFIGDKAFSLGENLSKVHLGKHPNG